jgi:hypothetical protein
MRIVGSEHPWGSSHVEHRVRKPRALVACMAGSRSASARDVAADQCSFGVGGVADDDRGGLGLESFRVTASAAGESGQKRLDEIARHGPSVAIAGGRRNVET